MFQQGGQMNEEQQAFTAYLIKVLNPKDEADFENKVAQLSENMRLLVFCSHLFQPMVQIKIWVLQDKVAPVCYEIIAYSILSGFFLDNRKNEMQVGMYQLIEFHTSGANSAGILFTTVFTADVTGISYCQR